MDAAHRATEQIAAGSTEARRSVPARRRNSSHSLMRLAADAIVAFALFGLVSACLMSAPSSANPGQAAFNVPHQTVSSLALKAIGEPGGRPVVQIATTGSAADTASVVRWNSVNVAWVLLALAFSGIVAMNLAVVRHLRRAYAAPRRISRPRRYTSGLRG